MLHDIQVKLTLPEGLPLVEATDEDLAEAMETEIGAFEAWFEDQDNAPLVGIERAIVRTFLAWKVRFEE